MSTLRYLFVQQLKMRRPQLSSRQIYYLKIGCIVIMLLNTIYECLASYLVTDYFRQDIYSPTGAYTNRDEIWRREFFKSSRNFFIFTTILSLLPNLMGILGVFKRNRAILAFCIIFMVVEWIFEMVGLYASQDWRVTIYKMSCQALRPLVILICAANCLYMETDANSERRKPPKIILETTSA